MRRFFVWFLIIVIALGVAADFLGRNYAQDKVATEIASAGKLSQTPNVSIGGFSFLYQVIRGKYDEITINSGRTTASQSLTINDVEARVRGLKVPASSLVKGRVPASLPTDTIAIDATAGYDEIATRMAAQSPQLRNLSLQRQANDQVMASANLRTPVGSIPVNVPLTFKLDGPTIHVTAGTQTLTKVAPAVRNQIGDALSADLRVPTLPYNLTVSEVNATDAGLQVKAGGRDLDLRDWAS